ncbi:hypothetical protein H310_08135 [Aphanomyces invadans]|uniref:Uncharacterized protein n=1 Tax=Aphanomyces invadans TaxID=157072 RepID=A0A024TZR3_9STRA|nr:hypothetical protein H310_08135 [Aphanomyces invadans]ETV99444.1 hypothetical protein H310_08135 [Aphanomyces invadans]|eukprot:XP_008872000.1 hypothetical protein H310_08135 [Aphanomyces invadans]
MASEGADFDMDESEILFGSNAGGSDSDSDDDDSDDPDGIEGTSMEARSRHSKPNKCGPGAGPSERTKAQHLPRVESWAVENRSSSRTVMTKQHKWKQQSHSMPAPSSGFHFATAHQRRRNHQLDFDHDSNDGVPLGMDHPESIHIPTSFRQSSYTHGGIPILSSAPLHWRRKSIEDSDDTHFVPPHQMVERDCFSLGMGHYFRHKPGNI